MSIFQMIKSGKCGVTITLFNKQNSIVLQEFQIFDVKPTLKFFKDRFKPFKKTDDAYLMRITSTPSCKVKEIKL